jgi:hypothetical protein
MGKIVGTGEGGQLSFHRLTKRRFESIELLLNSAANDLFIVSLCFIFVHLFAHVLSVIATSEVFVERSTLGLLVLPAILAAVNWFFRRSNVVFFVLAALIALIAIVSRRFAAVAPLDFFIFLSALPAFGAALASIANQGEFARLAKRSIAMASMFQQFADQIAELEKDFLSEAETPSTQLADVITLATNITQVMVDEVSDWRLVVAEQPMRVS